MTVFDDINAERDRQICKGYDAQHDDEHQNDIMLEVAADVCIGADDDWGIVRKWAKDRRRQLVIAAALIVAEIERMDRKSVPRNDDIEHLKSLGWKIDEEGEGGALMMDVGNDLYAYAAGGGAVEGYRTSVCIYRHGTDEFVGFINTDGKSMFEVHELAKAGVYEKAADVDLENVTRFDVDDHKRHVAELLALGWQVSDIEISDAVEIVVGELYMCASGSYGSDGFQTIVGVYRVGNHEAIGWIDTKGKKMAEVDRMAREHTYTPD